MGWGFTDPRQLAVLKGLTWWYDWGLTSNEGALAEGRRLGVEYVPMQARPLPRPALPMSLPYPLQSQRSDKAAGRA